MRTRSNASSEQLPLTTKIGKAVWTSMTDHARDMNIDMDSHHLGEPNTWSADRFMQRLSTRLSDIGIQMGYIDLISIVREAAENHPLAWDMIDTVSSGVRKHCASQLSETA